MGEPPAQVKVAIVGTGMAGLATAYLLSHDQQKRYRVTVFEQGSRLSLDSASVSLKDETGRVERVDLPMRAFAGGYYENLRAMYDHLGIRYQAKRFLFAFSQMNSKDGGASQTPYFIHSSNNHQLPPIRPAGVGRLRHLVEIVFLLVCYAWLTICCFVFQPRAEETLEQWTRRVWLPRRIVTHYLVPLLSSVATCTHEQLLRFPASDVTRYKQLSHAADHYVVSGGVHQAEATLAQELTQRLNAEVIKVEPQAGGEINLTWKTAGAGVEDSQTETFDRVVLAVSPDLVGALFPKLQPEMASIPVTWVDNFVIHPKNESTKLSVAAPGKIVREIPDRRTEADTIALLTTTGDSISTEAWHTVNCGAIVRTTNHLEDDAGSSPEVLHQYRFRRVLRSPQSRATVNDVLGLPQPQDIPAIQSLTACALRMFGLTGNEDAWVVCETLMRKLLYTPVTNYDNAKISGGELKKPVKGAQSNHSPATFRGSNPSEMVKSPSGGKWRNGDEGVWLVGGWCWDGMVLLEGCIVSAMQVARGFDVEIPWAQ